MNETSEEEERWENAKKGKVEIRMIWTRGVLDFVTKFCFLKLLIMC